MFLEWNRCKSQGFVSIHTRCGFWNVSLIFQTIFVLGLGFWIEQFKPDADSHGSGLCDGFQWEEMKFRRYLSFIWRFEAVSLILGFESSQVKPFSLPFSLFLVQILWNPLPLLLLLWLCDRCWSFSPLVRNSCLELQRNQFSDEDSSMNLWELMNLWWIRDEFLVLDKLGFMHLFFVLENSSLFVMWRELCGFFSWTVQCIALYRLPCGPWSNEFVTPGLFARHLNWIWT